MLPSSGYMLAFEESFGFIDDIRNATWIRFYKNPSLNPRLYRNESVPDNNSHNHGA
jgi:hypothetical protein